MTDAVFWVGGMDKLGELEGMVERHWSGRGGD